jgi:hypothetical protein
VEPLAPTVVARVSTVYDAVFGRKSTVVGCPAAEPGDTSMSIRFSFTQMGDTRPSGHWIGVNSRSSMTTSPLTWEMPAALTFWAN